MFDIEAHERAELEKKEAFCRLLASEIEAIPVHLRTAKAMAEAALAICRNECATDGDDPEFEVFMKTPEESKDYLCGTPGIYIVCWESGPYMWGTLAAMLITVATGKLVETGYGFDLSFYPQEDAA